MRTERERRLPMSGEGGQITVTEAGKRGGLTTKAQYGINHFRLAGSKGQAIFASRYTINDRRRWGALGGRPRKTHYQGEKGQCR